MSTVGGGGGKGVVEVAPAKRRGWRGGAAVVAVPDGSLLWNG